MNNTLIPFVYCHRVFCFYFLLACKGLYCLVDFTTLENVVYFQLELQRSIIKKSDWPQEWVIKLTRVIYSSIMPHYLIGRQFSCSLRICFYERYSYIVHSVVHVLKSLSKWVDSNKIFIIVESFCWFKSLHHKGNLLKLIHSKWES